MDLHRVRVHMVAELQGPMTQRAMFISTVTELLETDPKLVLLLGDISVFAFRHAQERCPDRVLNTGISEQAMVGMAAGLALSGFYPIIHTIDPFLCRRAYEQIYLDFGVQKQKGLFVTVGHDRDYAALGPSHHCPEGGTLMELVPGMEVAETFDINHVGTIIARSTKRRLLTYLRLSDK